LIIRYNGSVNLRDEIQHIWDYAYYWRVLPFYVNNKSCLRSNKLKTCVMMASATTEYDINKIVKGHYQAMLQSIQPLYPFLCI